MIMMSEFVQAFSIMSCSSIMSALILTGRIVPASIFGGGVFWFFVHIHIFYFKDRLAL